MTRTIHILLLICVFAGGIVIYTSQITSIEQSALTTLNSRNSLIEKYLDLIEVNTKSIKNTTEMGFKNHPIYSENDFPLKHLDYYAEYDIYGFTQIGEDYAENASTLSVLPSVNLNSIGINREAKMLFSSLPQFNMLVQDSMVEWVYYISKRGFMILVPKAEFENHHIKPSMYKSGLWNALLPQNNSKKETNISAFYQDSAGKGVMVTFSDPIYHNDEFKGAFAVDINTKVLIETLSYGLSAGHTYLLDKSGQVVNDHGQMLKVSEIGEVTSTNTNGELLNDQHGLYYSFPLVDGNLFLVHKITDSELRLLAAEKSAIGWLVLCIGYLLIILASHKHLAAKDNKRLMMIDPLTGINNRRGFETLMRSALESVEYTGKTYALLIADIDHFKRINDQLGHDVGDTALQFVASELASGLRGDCEIARWGGEEFVIFVPNVDADMALFIAERLRNSIECKKVLDTQMYTSVSIGISVGSKARQFEDTFNKADMALYDAKRTGRNKCCVYNENSKYED